MASYPEVNKVIWGALTIVVILASLILLIAWREGVAQSACWRETLQQLAPVTGYIESESIGVGKLLGKQDFSIGVSLKSACNDRVIFLDNPGDRVDACRKLCATGTEHYSPNREDCTEQCALCKGAKACIIAVPRTPGFVEGAKQTVENIGTKDEKKSIFDALRNAREDIKAYSSIYYHFSDLTVLAPDEGSKIVCLGFHKSGEFYTISVTKENAKSIEECDVTGVFDRGLT